jgi:hypothetical protein
MEQLNKIVKELIEISKQYKLDANGLDANCLLEQAVKIYLTGVIQDGKDSKTAPQNKPTEKQIALLSKMKVPNIDKLTKQEASKIIEERLNTPKDY